MKYKIKDIKNTSTKILFSFKIIFRTLSLLFSISKIKIIIVSLLVAIKVIIPIISAFIFGNLIMVLSLKNFNAIMPFIFYYVIFRVIGDIVGVFSSYIIKKIQLDLDLSLNTKIMQKCSNLSLKDFENSKVKDILQHIQSQISVRPFQILTDIISMSSSLISIIITLFVLARSLSYIIIILSVPFVIYTFISLLLCDKEFKNEEEQAALARKNWYLSYLLTNDFTFKEIRLLNLKDYILSKYIRNKNIIIFASMSLSKKRSIIVESFNLINNFIFLTVIIFIIFNMCQNNLIISIAVSLIQTLSIFYNSCYGFGDGMYGIYQNCLYMKKLFDFLELREIAEVLGSEIKIQKINSLEVNNLNFSYNNKDLVLCDINFKIKKGERIALFGTNGSGKSTLVKLISGLYKSNNKTILFNDYCINLLNKNILKKKIAVLFQDFTRYELTLRENIGFGDINCLNETNKLISAKKAAEIDFIDNFDQQLGFWFDDGIQLSGGQWQKIAIGRTLFNDADLYILDEPSSALDKLNENKIINHFMKITENKMGILISHKISNAMKADKIIFLDKGKIIATGSHDFMLENCSLYKSIYDLEFKVKGKGGELIR